MHRIVMAYKAYGQNGREEASLSFKINIADVPTVENMREAINLIRRNYRHMTELYGRYTIKVDIHSVTGHVLDINAIDDRTLVQLLAEILVVVRGDIEARFGRNLEEKMRKFISYLGMVLYRQPNGREDPYGKMGLLFGESYAFKATIREICRNLPDIDFRDMQQEYMPTYNPALATPEASQEMASFARWIIEKYQGKPFNRREHDPIILAGFKHICEYLNDFERFGY